MTVPNNQNSNTNSNQQEPQSIVNNKTQQVFYQNPEIESLLESSWITIKDGETAVLQFLTEPGKIKVLDKPDFNGRPTKRIQFNVINNNDPQRKEKTFELGKIHVEKIYAELKKGKTVLEISRAGQNKDTRYFVKAVK
jgi:hypothetical protein